MSDDIITNIKVEIKDEIDETTTADIFALTEGAQVGTPYYRPHNILMVLFCYLTIEVNSVQHNYSSNIISLYINIACKMWVNDPYN